ncbi:MAG: hypothetical protein GF401_02515 [Chitinivibrionales bacterium]|nr:hypothetical protein [Chitinivibrionales bacterium]
MVEKYRRNIKKGVLKKAHPIIFLVFTLLCLPPEQQASQKTRLPMSPYPMMFSNFKRNGFQAQTSSAKGEQRWFTPTTDTMHRNQPSVILVCDNGIAACYSERIQYMGSNGAIQWQQEIYPSMNPLYFDKQLFYLTSYAGLASIDEQQKTVLADFFFANGSPRGSCELLVPQGKNRFFIQVFSLGEEADPDRPAESNETSIILMGPEAYDDYSYRHEYDGRLLKGLVCSDNKHVILLDNAGTIRKIEIESGKETAGITIEGVEFLQAGLDNDDNIVVSLFDSKRKRKLCCFTPVEEKEKKPLWELDLPPDSERPFRQPPAIGPDNRVYYCIGNKLWAVDKGELLWNAPVFPSDYFQYITVLGDTTVFVAAANALRRLDSRGKEMFTAFLAPGENITTPAVVDSNGLIYFGTAAGIYCYE